MGKKRRQQRKRVGAGEIQTTAGLSRDIQPELVTFLTGLNMGIGEGKTAGHLSPDPEKDKKRESEKRRKKLQKKLQS